MACVRQRRGKWVVDFRDSAGKRRWMTYDTEEEATIEYGKLLAGGKAPSGFILVRDFYNVWIASMAPVLSTSTFKSYSTNFELHILPVFGGTMLKDIRRSAVRQFLNGKLDGGLSKGTVVLILASFRAMLSQAVEDEYLQVNPVAGLGRKLRSKGDGEEEEVKALLPGQIERLLGATGDILYRVLFFLLARTGMRVGEALALEVADLDLEGRIVNVKRCIHKGEVGSTKTGKGRTVDLSKQTCVILQNLLARRREECFARGRSMPKLLFPSDDDTHVPYLQAWRMFKKARTDAGLPEHLTIHSLRHSFASILLSEGVNPVYVQRMLGHASISMTVDIYGSWIPLTDRSAVDRLDVVGGAL